MTVFVLKLFLQFGNIHLVKFPVFCYYEYTDEGDAALPGEVTMSYDILSILEEKKPTFSKGQKRIAEYITEAYDKAAFMTANRLGKTVGVSESTVVRFAVDLGFDGYPSMQPPWDSANGSKTTINIK